MPTILISRINTAAIVGTTFTVVERMFMASPVRKVSKPAVPRLPTLPTLFPPGNDALLALVRLNLPHAPKAIPPRHFPTTPAEPLESSGRGSDDARACGESYCGPSRLLVSASFFDTKVAGEPGRSPSMEQGITGTIGRAQTMKLYAEVVSYFGSSNSIKARVALRVGSGSAGHSRRYGVGRNGRVCASPFSGIATFPEQSGRSFSHKSRGLTISSPHLNRGAT